MLVVTQAKGQVPVSSLPAVTVGCAQAKRSGVVAATMNEPEAPDTVVPSLTLSVVVWASKSLIREAVPTPSVKVTVVAVAGYSGACPLGELKGSLKTSVFEPV